MVKTLLNLESGLSLKDRITQFDFIRMQKIENIIPELAGERNYS